MITLSSGNLLDSSAKWLVCPVNCVGVMGAGLAKAFAERLPDVLTFYNEWCDSGRAKPGSATCGLARHSEGRNVWVVCVATKNHWRSPSKLKWIKQAAASIALIAGLPNCTSIAVPMLGCGLGGLDWNKVRRILEDSCSNVDCDVMLYETP